MPVSKTSTNDSYGKGLKNRLERASEIEKSILMPEMVQIFYVKFSDYPSYNL